MTTVVVKIITDGTEIKILSEVYVATSNVDLAKTLFDVYYSIIALNENTQKFKIVTNIKDFNDFLNE